MFDTESPAVFYGGNEETAQHRVWLRRKLRDGVFRPLVMTLHNPSTAGKVRNDPTARRGIALGIRLDASDLIFTNVVTQRATDANDIAAGSDLNCEWSDWAIQEAARLAAENSGWLVACWGGPKGKAAVKREIAARIEQVKQMELALQFSALRITASGHPEHPLYIPNSFNPTPWNYR